MVPPLTLATNWPLMFPLLAVSVTVSDTCVPFDSVSVPDHVPLSSSAFDEQPVTATAAAKVRRRPKGRRRELIKTLSRASRDSRSVPTPSPLARGGGGRGSRLAAQSE